MSRQEAANQYERALKAGQKQYRKSVAKGTYPYLQVLDEILDDSMIAGRVELGTIEIPMESIAGTMSAGRRDAFASNYMPLLSERTEFAAKWIALCQAHLSAEGINDPIRCFEYLGRFYVQEGNKRVSVLKSYGAASIPGRVVRLVPVWSEEREVRLYYEFLGAYQLTGLYQVKFTRFGSFPKLQAALGHAADYKWTEDDRRRFMSGYTYFCKAYKRLGGEALPITPADALLVWLKVYSYEHLKIDTLAQLTESLSSVWQDVKLIGRGDPIAVSTAPVSADKGLLKKLKDAMFRSHLRIALVNEFSPEESDWAEGHVRGIERMGSVFGEQVNVRIYNHAGSGDTAVKTMERAVSDGAEVIFATTAPLIDACRKIAARHPHVKVLNCSISMPYSGVRTYYSRIYEAKFLSGAIAGAMSQGDEIGYVASYPIFGVPAAINAFALGAQLTNPRARVKLQWSCVEGNPVAELAERGVRYISTLDIPSAELYEGKRGFCYVDDDGGTQLLASPFWDWGAFYIKLVESMMNGGWEVSTASGHDPRAVNYWWGLSGGVIGVKLDDALPAGVRSLVRILKRGIVDGSVQPFNRYIASRDGTVRNDGERRMTAEEILHMDWLCDNVDGEIPPFEALLPEARAIVRTQGIYRDSIPPEAEGVLL